MLVRFNYSQKARTEKDKTAKKLTDMDWNSYSVVELIMKFSWVDYFASRKKPPPAPKPCDNECINRARQYTFDTSRKYRRNKPHRITDDIQRGLELLQSDCRFQNKKVVAEIKAKNNAIKAKNRKLQKISREYFRAKNPDLEYDFTRWDKIPRRIYEEAEWQFSLETMNNPIIKWVLN